MASEVLDTVTPTEQDSELAGDASHKLARLLGDLRKPKAVPDGPITIELRLDHDLEIVSLPASALELLNHILTQMAQGNAVSILPMKCELTTQQSANFLNVSRPYLISLLDDGKIPYYRVGTHRRVLFKDLVEYKKQRSEKRRGTLAELAEQAQELNMGY